MTNESLAMLRRAASVSLQVARERVQRPRVTSTSQVPGSVDQLTEAYLTEILCGDVPGARVESFRLGSGSSGSHERRQLLLQYNALGTAAGLPPAVFTKSLPSVVTRMLVGYLSHARFEMLFYRTTRPDLAIETPLCYFSASDKNTLAALHVLEDVTTTKGARFDAHRTVVDRARAEDMVDLMAELHGSFLGSARLNDDLRWLVAYPRWFRIGVEKVHTDRYLDKALTKAANVVPDALLERRDDVWPAVMRALEIHDQQLPTIIHSDIHIANWYVTDANRMGLTDWQCINSGHWSRDVSSALATALTVEDRREWEEGLLRRYLERLEERSGIAYTFDQAWPWYRQQMLHALTDWTQTLCHPRLVPDSHEPDLTYTMLNRISTAIADLDSIDSFETIGALR